MGNLPHSKAGTFQSRITPEQELAYLEADLDLSELSWAAGFFDGEGSIGTVHDGRRLYLQMQLGQAGSTEELERFVKAIGIPGGKVYGPYGVYRKEELSKLPKYRVILVGRAAKMAMERLAPLLCSRKRASYNGALAKIAGTNRIQGK